MEEFVARLTAAGELDRLSSMDAQYRRLEAENWLEQQKSKSDAEPAPLPPAILKEEGDDGNQGDHVGHHRRPRPWKCHLADIFCSNAPVEQGHCVHT